jgi:DNA repair protein RadC
MSADRREKFRQVLSAIRGQSQFTATAAKQACREISPQFTTSALKQLVRDQVLDEVLLENQRFLQWRASADSFDADAWIDRQIHGTQVTQTPQEDRPRERLLRNGAAQLSTADLLAILIRVGVKGESAIQAGQRIVNRLGGDLTNLPGASAAELRQVSPAVTQASYSQIMAGIELGRRIAEALAATSAREVSITSSAAAIEYCRQRFRRLATDGQQEEFHIVTLDTKHQPIGSHQITVGTLDASLVHPREVFRAAIRDAAAAILLVHNHPSGDPTPSKEDFAVTRRLKEAGECIGIRILDHIIVAGQTAVSLMVASSK